MAADAVTSVTMSRFLVQQRDTKGHRRQTSTSYDDSRETKSNATTDHTKILQIATALADLSYAGSTAHYEARQQTYRGP